MKKRILIATPVHQEENIFKEFLFSLNKLIIPNNFIANFFFILHNCSNLKKYLENNQYIEEIDKTEFKIPEEGRKFWKDENFYTISKMRTKLLEKAREENYDYLFMVDSDVLLHPKLLQLLINDNKDIVSSLSWTKPDTNTKIEAPCGPYEGWKMYDDVEFAKIPGLYKIGWTGRCTLISSKIFNNKNISYYPVQGVAYSGEDYAFCLRCYCNIPNIEICIETRLPSRHLYNKKEYNRWIKEKNKFLQEINS